MQNTAYTPDDSSINITFGGLPFTSQSYAGGGGYNNNWFKGFGTGNGNFTAPKLYVKDNSTVWGNTRQVAVNKVETYAIL